jgi:predicted transcriptional regulator
MPTCKISCTETNLATRNQLVGYLKATGNVAEAARELGLASSTASDIWSHFKVAGFVENEKRPGRPHITNDYDNCKMA